MAVRQDLDIVPVTDRFTNRWRLIFAMLALLPAAATGNQKLAALDAETVAGMSFDDLMAVSVTVASRLEEWFVEAPSSVTVFTRSEILNMGLRTVEELLNHVPGMQSTHLASRNSYSVATRGRMSSRGSNDVLFLIDGQRINDDFSGATLLFNRYLTVGNVKQVEVIRGPGSALYGSNAFLAVVNIVTATDLNEVFAAAGDLGNREGYVNLSTRDEGYSASLFLGGLTDDGDDFTDLSDPQFADTSDPRSTYTAYARFEAGPLKINARHSAVDLDEFYLYGFTPANDINEFETRDSSVGLSYRLLDHERESLDLSGSYRRLKGEALLQALPASTMEALPTTAPAGQAAPFTGGPVMDLSEWHLALDGAYRFNSRHRLIAGVSYRRPRYDKLRNQNNYETTDFIDVQILGNPGTIAFYGDTIETADFGPSGDHRTILGVYGQDRIEINDQLTLTLGVRYDDYSDVGSTLNPRTALVYTTPFDATFKLLYGEAFRAPTVAELAMQNAPDNVGNPGLDPEKVQTLELAWLQKMGHLQTTLTGYYSRLSDRIVPGPNTDPSDPRLTFVNGDDIDLSGLEFELNADLTKRLFLRGTYTHLFKTEDDPRGMARDLGSLSANYARGTWNLNLNTVYHGSVQLETSEELDDYWESNANLRYQWNGLTLVGSVYNLTDEDYQTFTRTAGLVDGTPNRGRSFRVGAEYSF